MNEEIIELIEQVAKKPTYSDDDDFVVDDCAGGNVDDAFSCGMDEGEILFARKLLELMQKAKKT